MSDLIGVSIKARTNKSTNLNPDLVNHLFGNRPNRMMNPPLGEVTHFVVWEANTFTKVQVITVISRDSISLLICFCCDFCLLCYFSDDSLFRLLQNNIQLFQLYVLHLDYCYSLPVLFYLLFHLFHINNG